ncbi:TetR family transcriptional regulator [Streptomyces sp. MAR4 CNX-425]|uniref:TetR/AcrR family transcriptional regulator n=1 Tax=Streptomyces sp. MAR4 CNX-425 TaxID=3406343 RepID=UPI003B505B04
MGRGRTGRRPGNQDTRGVILTAAREAFSQRGYDGASIKQIATSAGVDAALVHHYFGTKEKLFLAVVRPPIDPALLIPQVLAGGPEGVPTRIVRTFLQTCEGPVTGPAFLGMLRGGTSHRWQGLLLRDFFTTQIVRRVLDNREDIGDPSYLPLRTSLVASQLFGLALTRYVLKFEPLASAHQDAVVTAVAPTIARYIAGDITAEIESGSSGA